MKKDLKDVTFIIPVRLESNDRIINSQITLKHLLDNFDTNIIVLEHDSSPKFADRVFQNNIPNSVTLVFENSHNQFAFHRTRFLNQMLFMVQTPIVVNYDVDVLLDVNTYVGCRNEIRNGADLVYPYFWGNSQWQVQYSGRQKLQRGLNLSKLRKPDVVLTRSEYGHCQFFNTDSYKKGGGENEYFVSYAPEDQERGYRFKELGYQVKWGTSHVYHLEHVRTENSSSKNPMMSHNFGIFDKLKSLSKSELIEYYKDPEYLRKYQRP